jgi:hypothetical protein
MKLFFAHAYFMSWTPFQHQPINFYSPKIVSNSSSKNTQYSIMTALASQNTQHMRETSCHSPSSHLWLLSNLMYYLLPLYLRSNINAKYCEPCLHQGLPIKTKRIVRWLLSHLPSSHKGINVLNQNFHIASRELLLTYTFPKVLKRWLWEHAKHQQKYM